jgi:hypothetical protein
MMDIQPSLEDLDLRPSELLGIEAEEAADDGAGPLQPDLEPGNVGSGDLEVDHAFREALAGGGGMEVAIDGAESERAVGRREGVRENLRGHEMSIGGDLYTRKGRAVLGDHAAAHLVRDLRVGVEDQVKRVLAWMDGKIGLRGAAFHGILELRHHAGFSRRDPREAVGAVLLRHRCAGDAPGRDLDAGQGLATRGRDPPGHHGSRRQPDLDPGDLSAFGDPQTVAERGGEETVGCDLELVPAGGQGGELETAFFPSLGT